MRRSTGGQFAPEVVEALERLLDAGLGVGDAPVDQAAERRAGAGRGRS